jgi:hypothetical protein
VPNYEPGDLVFVDAVICAVMGGGSSLMGWLAEVPERNAQVEAK